MFIIWGDRLMSKGVGSGYLAELILKNSSLPFCNKGPFIYYVRKIVGGWVGTAKCL